MEDLLNKTFILSTISGINSNSIEISNGIYWEDFESTKALINNGKINKNNIRFFLATLVGKKIN
jgi:putative transcriptional regulator